MHQVRIGLGGNLGDVPATFAAVFAELTRHPECRAIRRSASYRSAPMGSVAGDPFWNAVFAFETSLSPDALLEQLQAWETEFGRVRTVRWGPRTLDLDVLVYGDLVRTSPRLTLPHPGLVYRRFVLDPLCELDPQGVDPATGMTFSDLRGRLLGTPTIWLPHACPDSVLAAIRARLATLDGEIICDYVPTQTWPERGVVLQQSGSYPVSTPWYKRPKVDWHGDWDDPAFIAFVHDVATAAFLPSERAESTTSIPA